MTLRHFENYQFGYWQTNKLGWSHIHRTASDKGWTSKNHVLSALFCAEWSDNNSAGYLPLRRGGEGGVHGQILDSLGFNTVLQAWLSSFQNGLTFLSTRNRCWNTMSAIMSLKICLYILPSSELFFQVVPHTHPIFFIQVKGGMPIFRFNSVKDSSIDFLTGIQDLTSSDGPTSWVNLV